MNDACFLNLAGHSSSRFFLPHAGRRTGPRRRGCNGYTLLEIMIALTISLILIGGTLQIFTSSKFAYRIQDHMSRVQENGRVATELMAKDLRMAGFIGCLSVLTHDTSTFSNTLNNSSGFLYNFGVPAQGFNAAPSSAFSCDDWSPSLDSTLCTLSNPPSQGTDVLSLRIMRNTLPVEDPPMPTVSASLYTIPNTITDQFDIAIVSDCEAAAVFQVTNADVQTSGEMVHDTGLGTPGNVTQNFPKTFSKDNDAVIYLPAVESYYIAPGASGRPALWKLVNSSPVVGGQNPVELVEGVENMQVLYGEDTDEDQTADIYVTADNISDWNNLVGIRVNLLLQTLADHLTIDPQAYTYNGATVTDPGDRRLRRVFTVSVGVRNRLK